MGCHLKIKVVDPCKWRPPHKLCTLMYVVVLPKLDNIVHLVHEVDDELISYLVVFIFNTGRIPVLRCFCMFMVILEYLTIVLLKLHIIWCNSIFHSPWNHASHFTLGKALSACLQHGELIGLHICVKTLLNINTLDLDVLLVRWTSLLCGSGGLGFQCKLNLHHAYMALCGGAQLSIQVELSLWHSQSNLFYVLVVE